MLNFYDNYWAPLNYLYSYFYLVFTRILKVNLFKLLQHEHFFATIKEIVSIVF